MSNYRRRLMLANQTEENLVLYGNSVQDGTPTPEIPIDIMSLENPIIKITGKNLFNKEAVEKLSMYIGTDNWWVSSDSSSFRIKCEPNKSYVISGENPSCTIFRAGYIITDDLPAEGLGIKLYNIKRYSSFNQPITITTGEEAKYLVVQVNSGAWEQNIEKLQIEEGLNVTEYEPYEEELIAIDETTPFGKNLLSPSSSKSTATPFTFDASAKDGSYIINGTGDKTSYSIRYLRSGVSFHDMLVDGETYTFAMDVSEQKGINILVRATKLSDNSNVYYTGFKSNNYCTTFKVDKSKYKYQELYLQINPTSETYENVVVKPIMVLGSYTELPFEPYIPPITTMRGIGDYKDRICTRDGKVWFEQNIRNKVVDKFSGGISAHSTIEAFTSSNKIPKVVSDSYPYVSNKNQMSNIGVYDVNYNKTGELHWYIARDGSFLIPPDTETWTNATDAYEYFMSITGNTPMEYQYVLANPIITEITGALAEKILAIDKSKNICFISENGIQGETEVIEE